jgi:hypothetical protein
VRTGLVARSTPLRSSSAAAALNIARASAELPAAPSVRARASWLRTASAASGETCSAAASPLSCAAAAQPARFFSWTPGGYSAPGVRTRRLRQGSPPQPSWPARPGPRAAPGPARAEQKPLS